MISSETRFAGQCRAELETIADDTFDRLVTVSGDGLVNEMINGIMKRKDCRRFVKAHPIGVIPAGSGNALAASLGVADPLAAALAIIKGSTLFKIYN